VAPALTVPSSSEQTDPAAADGEQIQPGDELAATKVVLAGTVSVTATPKAFWVPVFVTVML